MTEPRQPHDLSTSDIIALAWHQQKTALSEKVFAGLPPTGASVSRLSDISARNIVWLWDRWIPSRMLTILAGVSGDGKSTVIASLIGALTTGGTLPDGTTARRTNILLISAEDDTASSLRPRLDPHRADSKRVFILNGTVRGDGRTRAFDLTHDVDVMRDVIRKNRIGLVIIDPISACLASSDHLSETHTRDALQPLKRLMEQTNVGIVGLLRLGRVGESLFTAQQRSGTAALMALARSVLMVADQPDHPQPDDTATSGRRKVLQVVRSNVSIPPAPLAFHRPLDGRVEWLGPSEVGIDECAALPTARERGRIATERNDAVEFLREILADGPVPTSEILSQARAQGFSERTLRRAKKLLAIRATRTENLTWTWSLGHDAPDSQHPAGYPPTRNPS